MPTLPVTNGSRFAVDLAGQHRKFCVAEHFAQGAVEKKTNTAT